MKRILILFLAGFAFLNACSMSKPNQTDIEAHDYWARAAMKDGNSAAYMLLRNQTKSGDELTGVSTDIASAAEIHLSQLKANGTMEMIKQESIPLPVNAEVKLKPGSYHIMFIGLKKDIKAGDEISLTLHFKNHEDIKLTVPVLDAAKMGGAGMDGHTH